jgi:ribosome-binding factor A
MAQGRRVERVAALIRREMSELLRNGIRDERVQQGLVSVTQVEVAGDLQHCRIFVSVYGSESDRDQAMAGLKAATPFVKGVLARRLQMRRTPDLVFQLDRGLEKGSSVLGLLQQLEQERQERDTSPESQGTEGDADTDTEEDNGDGAP